MGVLRGHLWAAAAWLEKLLGDTCFLQGSIYSVLSF